MLTPSLVQSKSALALSAAPFQVVMTNPPTVGNVVVGNMAINVSAAGKSASLGGASSMTTIREALATGAVYSKNYVKQVASDDTATLTYTDTTPPTNSWLEAQEWANCTSTLDGTAGGTIATGVSTLASASITTTQANSLIVCQIWWNGASSAPSITAGFTILLNNSRFCTAYLIAATAGTYTPTWSWTTARNAGSSIYALKARSALTAAQAGRGFLMMGA